MESKASPLSAGRLQQIRHMAPPIAALEALNPSGRGNLWILSFKAAAWNLIAILRILSFKSADQVESQHSCWDEELNGYGSIPINTISNGMNIHLPAILGFTRYQGFDPSLNLANLTSENQRTWTHQQPTYRKGSHSPDYALASNAALASDFFGRPNSGILMHFAILPGKWSSLRIHWNWR